MKALKKLKETKKKPPSRSYQAERHLRKFCNVTSQELGNVLGAVVGELDFALASRDSATRDRSMQIALTAAEQALNLSRNLRYFAVHTRLDARVQDLSQIVLDTIDLLENELEARRIKLSVLVEASAFATVDSGAIQQCLLNLISNAAHAMRGGGKLSVSLRRVRHSIEIRCADTGIGIAAEDLERVFEPYFFSGAQALTESQGLGLAVAKALVEAHGGEISVESQKGIGTAFTLVVPAEPDYPPPSPQREKRRYRRVSATLPIEFTVEGSPPVRTELTTLSVGGCFVRLPDVEKLDKAARNKAVSLRIAYFGSEWIAIPQARIASICRIHNHTGFGIEFIEYDAKARKLLAALVKSHSS